MRDLGYIEIDSDKLRNFTKIPWGLFLENQCNFKGKINFLSCSILKPDF